MNRFHFFAATMLALLWSSAFLRAAAPDDEYVRIYDLIQHADALAESGQGELARQQYSEARGQLERLQMAHPGWNRRVVQFRLSYVREKLGLAKTAENPTRRESAEKTAPASAETTDRIESLEQIRQLTADKELLQAKLKEALSAQPVAVDPLELARAEEKIKSLRKEVDVLAVNLKKAETKPDKPIDPAAFERAKLGLMAANQKLAQQTEALASLTLERDALQRRVQMSTDGTEFKSLRGENESLKGAQQSQIESLTYQNIVLRARLAALEARAIPYSPEELALFPIPNSIGAITAFNDDEKSSGKPTGDARLLVNEAERALVMRHYSEAEKKYAQAMRLDEKNVLLRANLAAAQIGQNRLAEGEATLRRALASDPNNTASLTLLGVVKVRQRRYDEALDLLSQSAQLDPHNADTFQYLGLTLSEKGLRKPAESAFRRAIELAPENADAHHSLAIVYATQQPPALELARLHYQKGLAGGHVRDARLEQMLSTNKSATIGGANALKNR